MSTKTLRKRIALVAVSALGAGMLSLVAVPAANAAAGTGKTPIAGVAYISPTASTNGSASAATLTVYAHNADNTVLTTTDYAEGTSVGYVVTDVQAVTSGSLSSGAVLSNGAISFLGKSGTKLGVVATNGIITATDGGSDAVISGSLASAYDGTAEAAAFVVKPTGAVGSVMTVSFYAASTVSATSPTNGTLIGTFALTIVASGSSNIVSAAKSSLIVDTSSSFASTVDQAAGFSLSNGATGYVTVSANDAYGVPLSGTHAVTVSATNGAKVGFSAYPSTSSAVTTSIPSGVYVNQGTANAAVSTEVSVLVDGVSIGSKTITFAGDLSKIAVTVLGIAQKGSAAATNIVLAYKAYDAAGNRVALAAPSIKGTDAVVNTGAVQTAETATVTGTVGFNCATYGTNTGLYLQATNTAGATIVSDKFAISCAGDMYTYTAKLDKSTYKQGEIATLTISGFDVKGKPSNDIQVIGSATYKPAISGSYMTAVNAPLYTDYTTNGVITYTFIVGNTAGSYSMAVDLPLLTNPAANATDVSKTVGYSIASDGGVSNAEVLAAIVNLIASINKQIAALQKALTKKK